MKVKYKEGDIFIIPIRDKFAICQVIFSPKGKFKQVIGFCVLFIQSDKSFKNDGVLCPITIIDMGKETKIIFTGNQNIKNGFWEIIDHVDLTEDKKRLRVFNYAGGLYDGEEEIRRIPVSEYPNYTSMEVCGFELIQNILTSI
ncbi:MULTISPECIES: Imm26 family immunity protein [unclassified Brenneria]|uniref:Imm26 family immunity protein n=1 Tax=unclassified Brenneria TaxID=2634434 RepID=UPI0029C5FA9E|nr:MULTISPECIES: Imm26 family immunity protein [unclassified Brenneria]MDX5631128.1 Imm26 family immunity protein [Brenneria sp. L3-3Z]MDX5698201.1 Imm26 family immunity protein [Brenneria sp. L4-2C]